MTKRLTRSPLCPPHAPSVKQSVYLPGDVLDDIHEEAARQERSLSWVVQKAWEMAKAEIKQNPASEGPKLSGQKQRRPFRKLPLRDEW